MAQPAKRTITRKIPDRGNYRGLVIQAHAAENSTAWEITGQSKPRKPDPVRFTPPRTRTPHWQPPA